MLSVQKSVSRISSFGREMETLRIRLPRGSQPIEVDDPKYTTTFVLPKGETSSDPTAVPIAIIKLTEPTTGPVDIQLAVEQTRSPQDANATIDVLGFEVVDAVRQFGNVALIAGGDWLVRWQDNSDLRRIVTPSDSLPQENLVAAFEYYSQPATLPIRVLAKETQINVDPTLLLDVQEDRINLESAIRLSSPRCPHLVSAVQSGWLASHRCG